MQCPGDSAPRRFADARQRQGSKTDLCHPATVAEGQGHARDKIARYLGVGRTTIERAEAVVEEINPTNGIPVVQVLVLRFPAWSPQASPLRFACEWR